MFAWWWLVVMFFVGAFLGAMIMGVCAYDNMRRGGKKWWEDD